MQTESELSAIAERLDQAAIDAVAIDQLAEEIDIRTAYEVQRLSMARRMARGERRLGIKMGVTSKAKMAQVGVTEMIWGMLTSDMQIANGGKLDMTRFIHPRAEPEIAFLIGKPLSGEVSEEEAAAAIKGVASAIEVIDSRFRNFKFRITDVIADNSSSSAFVVGPWHAPDTDVGDLKMTLEFDGQVVGSGSTEAILGHPLRSLAEASAILARYGDGLKPGDILLSGSATAAEPLRPGAKVQVRVNGLDGCGFEVA